MPLRWRYWALPINTPEAHSCITNFTSPHKSNHYSHFIIIISLFSLYSWFSLFIICKFTYPLKFIYNLKINTWSIFVIIFRHELSCEKWVNQCTFSQLWSNKAYSVLLFQILYCIQVLFTIYLVRPFLIFVLFISVWTGHKGNCLCVSKFKKAEKCLMVKVHVRYCLFRHELQCFWLMSQ